MATAAHQRWRARKAPAKIVCQVANTAGVSVTTSTHLFKINLFYMNANLTAMRVYRLSNGALHCHMRSHKNQY
jgi:hypothetical protein